MKRVLWFVNIPPSATAGLLSEDVLHHAAWINALIPLVKAMPGIELGIAFPAGRPVADFLLDGIRYFPLDNYLPARKLDRLVSKLFSDGGAKSLVDQSLGVVEKLAAVSLIHVFGTERAFGLIIPRVQVPVVIQLQGLVTEITKRMYAGISFSRQLFLSWNSPTTFFQGLYNYHVMRTGAARERKLMSTCRYFIGRTDWDREVAQRFAPSSKYYYCSEPLRPEIYNTSWSAPVNAVPRLFSIMRAAPYKGLECLLDVYRRLRKDLPQLQLRIAGTTWNEPYPAMVKKLFPDLADDPAVIFLGEQTPAQIAEELAACDCYVHPSHIENSPNSVCEAMAMGVPIVSTNVGGIPTLIRDGEDGLLVPPANPERMVNAVLRVLKDTPLRGKLSQNARASARRRHTLCRSSPICTGFMRI